MGEPFIFSLMKNSLDYFSVGGRYSFDIIKNKEKEEVDFLIADRRKPLLLLEAKQAF